MKKRILSLALIFALIFSSMVLASCKKGEEEEATSEADFEEIYEEELDTDSEEFEDMDSDPAYENEMDGAEPVMVAHEEKDFYGTWSARSERAHYVFGNVDLVINEDGTWTGNIVEEDFSGTWEYVDSSLNITSSDNLIKWNLFYVEDGSLMFKDLDDPDLAPLVLKAQ